VTHEILTWLLAGGLPLVVVAIGTGAVVARRRRVPPAQDGAARRASAATRTATPPAAGIPSQPAPPPGETLPEGVGAPEAPPAAPQEPPAPVEAVPPLAPSLETPAPTAGRLTRLRDRLARSGSPLGARLLAVLSRDRLSDADWDEIEETLLLADVGAGPTGEIVEALRTRVRVTGTGEAGAVRALLREQLLDLVDPSLDRSLDTAPTTGEDGASVPAIVLVVGVNGTGKTTTVGKLARVLVADGRSVVLGAADTFRAAAAEQLTTWGARVGVPTVRADREGADPASVAFDAVRTAQADGADVVLVDTAGRLQNKAGLMDELGKITRVLTRTAPLSEVLLVLDATTGQNGLNQARVFTQVAGVTGIVLTKLDGTAKGGIVVAVQRELGVPVKLVGLGEGPDDLAPFDPEAFVDGLLGS
jgi:fused signal recognition particle receptor